MDKMEGNRAVFNMGRHLALRPLVNDLLPYPANVHRWSLVEDPNFHMCDKHNETYHVIMPQCTSTGSLQMEVRYCPQGDVRHSRTCKKKEETHKKGISMRGIAQLMSQWFLQ